jgi:hypothetical protein
MSNLYKEALADVQKLRELAEDSAKKEIVESALPAIRSFIEKTLLESDEADVTECGDDMEKEFVESTEDDKDEENVLTDDDSKNESFNKLKAEVTSLCENVDEFVKRTAKIKRVGAIFRMSERAVARLDDMYRSVKESSSSEAEKKPLIEALEDAFSKIKNKETSEEIKMKKRMSEGKVTLELSGEALPDDLDLGALGVSIVADEEGGAPEGDEEQADVDAAAPSDGSGDDTSDAELDSILGGAAAGEEEKKPTQQGESRGRKDADPIVEVDERMLRREIMRVRARIAESKKMPVDDFGGGEDMGDPWLDADVTTEGLEGEEPMAEEAEEDDEMLTRESRFRRALRMRESASPARRRMRELNTSIVAERKVRQLYNQLRETNLMLAKTKVANKIVTNDNLTKAQKASACKRVNEASSLKELRLVYETAVSTAMSDKKPMTEGKSGGQLLGSSSRTVKSGAATASKETLSESAELDRWSILAGIKLAHNLGDWKVKMLTYQDIMEGIQDPNRSAEEARIVKKWTKTGLLKGLEGQRRSHMARLLENQAVGLIKEANALSTGGGNVTTSGQIAGFANIAFPIVRRVFGGLVANELVSVQPMSLPSGLVFYIDYGYGSNVGGDAGVSLSSSSANETYTVGQSLYNNPPGKGVQSGSLAAGGMYDLVGSGFSKVHSGSNSVSASAETKVGAFTGVNGAWTSAGTVASSTDFSGSNARFCNFDPDVEAGIEAGTFDVCFVHVPTAQITSAIANVDLLQVDQLAITAFSTANGATAWGESFQAGTGVLNLRKLNKRGNFNGTTFTPDALNGDHIQFVVRLSNAGSVPVLGGSMKMSGVVSDKLQVDSSTGSTLTLPSYESDFGSSSSPVIAEVNIKVESIAITATSRKLRARWSPELAQDLNAYHNIDAEVELTQVLSEQIALEIDREILQDLLTQANGANLYWSRAPGVFVNKLTGAQRDLSTSLSIGPQFTGNTMEWAQTLVETINDVANTIHRKTLRGSANFIVTSPDVCTIIESAIAYKAKLSIDGNGQVASPFQMGAEAIGTLNNRFTVYKDPYFPRNRILVGYKGGNYLETGYVYAPYVPLIMTQTIYNPQDFTPTKGVMTRYGKKMIRSDYFGTVTVLNMNIILSIR